MRFQIVAAAAVIAAPLLPLQGQITAVREGQRVRISSTSAKELVGVVKESRADSIVVFTEPSGASFAIATSDLRRVEVSRGRGAGEGAKRGALWGGGIGAAFAALGAVLIAADDNAEFYPDENGVAVFAANMIAGGVVWGAAIGAFVKAERWDRMTIRPRVGLSAIGVSIAVR